jgi:hypothetical protein
MERVQIRGLPEGDYQVQCKTKDNWEKLSQTILPDCRSGGSIDAYYEFTKDGQWHINGSKVQDVEEVTYEDWKEAIETHIRRVGDFKVGDLVYITKGYFDLKKGDVPALEGFDGTHWWIKTKEYPKIFLDKDENFRHATPEEIAASASVSPSNIMVTKDNAVVGLEVVRGRDWDYGDQDHFEGKPSVGTIAMEYGYFPSNKNSGWVKVKWKGGSTDSYEIGTDLDDDEKYDLYVYQGSTEPVKEPAKEPVKSTWFAEQKQEKEEQKEESQTIIISKQTNTKTEQNENIKESSIGISITEQCFITSGSYKFSKAAYIPGDEERITKRQRRQGSAVRG